MKQFIYTTILLLIFNSCTAQKKIKMEQEIVIPEITKEFEVFNIAEFQAENSSKVQKVNGDHFIIYTGDTKKTKVKSGYSEVKYLIYSYFSVVKNFYVDGKIEIKGVSFNNGSEYGIWYEFDKEGKLTDIINMDEGYDFGWADVIRYCIKNEIPLTKGYPEKGGIKTEIYKNEEEGKKVWVITYYKIKNTEYAEVTLDGKTGKQLRKRKLELTGS